MSKILKMLEAFFTPSIKLMWYDGLLFPTDDESKAIIKIYEAGRIFLLESEYDSFLRFVSEFGLSISVEYP